MDVVLPKNTPIGLHLLTVSMQESCTREDARLRIRQTLKAKLYDLFGSVGNAAELYSTPGEALRLAAPLADIGLSISHERGLSVAAINVSGRVGVDVMRWGEALPDMKELALDYLGPTTYEMIQRSSKVAQPKIFARAWTAREACLKCQGVPLVEWTVALDKSLSTCNVMVVELAPSCVATVAFFQLLPLKHNSPILCVK